MNYLAAWFCLSLLGCAAWYLLTPFTEDEDVEQQLYRAGAAINGVCVQSALRQRALSDAGEENDAAIGAMVSTTVGGE
jgi:hypothetical protein